MAYEFRIKNGLIANGSATISGSITATGNITTPQLVGTASQAVSASWSPAPTSASFAATASYSRNLQVSGSVNNVDYIDFNTGSAVPAWRSGRVFWDNTDGALSVYNAEADITLQVGQENWARVWNASGTTIHNGDPVRLSGTHGDAPQVVLAQSILVSGSVTRDNQILGLATHDIEINTFGYVTTKGLVRGLNTNAYADGDRLYVSSSAGQLTKIPPAPPYELIPAGFVVKAGPGGSGIIYADPYQPVGFSDLNSAEKGTTYGYGDLWTYVLSGSVGVWRHTNQLSGSYAVTGSWRATAFTGSLQGTASYATQALSASWAPGGGSAFPYTGSAGISGSLSIDGKFRSGNPLFVGNVGQYSHTEGDSTYASGIASHAEGYYTRAEGDYAHAEGSNAKASGSYSHAEGDNTTASATVAHAEGSNTIATGVASHAEGLVTQANGEYSHAEGDNTQANALGSHAEGLGNITSDSYQHAQGTYNLPVSGSGAFILGNGYYDVDLDTTIQRNLIYASGSSFQITGSLHISGSITGSLQGTASYATQALSASWAPGGGAAFPYTGSAGISGSLLVNGNTVNIGTFTNTGSVAVSGSITLNGQQLFTGQESTMFFPVSSSIWVPAYFPPRATGGSYAGTNNRLVVWPFVPARTFTCSGLVTQINTPATGSMKFLIYSNNPSTFLPLNRLYESTTVSTVGTGNRTVLTSFKFEANTPYWFGIHVSGSGGLNITGNTDGNPLYLRSGSFEAIYGYVATFTYGAGNSPVAISSSMLTGLSAGGYNVPALAIIL